MGYEEPWLLAEREALKRDMEMERFPICARCNCRITDTFLIYNPSTDEHFCLECIEAMKEINPAAELEE